jgi:hypothetical protein
MYPIVYTRVRQSDGCSHGRYRQSEGDGTLVKNAVGPRAGWDASITSVSPTLAKALIFPAHGSGARLRGHAAAGRYYLMASRITGCRHEGTNLQEAPIDKLLADGAEP